jgi:ABC-2 type transport system ATP-binding protein
MSIILATQSLSRRFRDTLAVDDLNLEIAEGSVFGLLGPNGAGKTTTLKMLTTLLPPTTGTAVIAGYDIRRQARQVRKIIGYVPQLLSADGTLTGYENLLIFAKLYDVPRTQQEDRINTSLEFMGLGDAAHRLVREYSGGMIRRLEVAQSLLHRPRVLFLDEPTTGLDPSGRKMVWDHLAELRAGAGTTILLTTHLMEEADHMCDQVAIMHLGRVAATGAPTDLKRQVDGGRATLDDVFLHFTGGSLDSGGSYRDTFRARRTAHRLG